MKFDSRHSQRPRISQPGTPLSESGGPIPGDFQFSYIDNHFPDDSGVGSQLPSGIPDVASVLVKQPEMLLTDSDDIFFTHADAPLPDVSGVGYQFASVNLDPVGDLARDMRRLLSGSSDNYIFLAGVHIQC